MLDVYADVRRGVDGDAGDQGREDRGRALPGRGADVLHRGDDAGPQGAAGRHQPLPRPELRARRASIQFLDQNGAQQHAWTTSWGVSTRLIGALIMTHSDDDGFVLPPRLAPRARRDPADLPHRRREGRACSSTATSVARGAARAALRRRAGRACIVDERDVRGGDKVWEWVKKGVPLRLEIGPRDIEKDARVRRPPRPRAEGQAERAARRVRRDDRSDAAGDPGRPVRARAGAIASSTRAASTPRTSSTRSSRAPREAGERADADPRRLRADALQRRRRSSRRRSRTSSASPCAASRSRRASRAPARSPASRARSASCGRRRIDRSGGACGADSRLAAAAFLRRAVGLHGHLRPADHACRRCRWCGGA